MFGGVKTISFLGFLLVIATVMLVSSSVSGNEFLCKDCIFNECSEIGTNELGWANCFDVRTCFPYVPPGCGSCPVETRCIEYCHVTESCTFPPVGW